MNRRDTPGSTFLAQLTPVEREALWRAGGLRRFRVGAALLPAGEPAHHVALVTAGRVKVGSVSHDGHEAVLGIRGPGDIVGEQSLIDAGPRSSSVTALEPAEALVVPAGRFSVFLTTQPRAAIVLAKVLVMRLRDADAQRLEFAACSVRERLARFLLRLCEGHGRPHEGGILITVPLSQRDLAGATGASREAVVKALRELRGRGLVTTQRRRITVLHPGGLREVAGFR